MSASAGIHGEQLLSGDNLYLSNTQFLLVWVVVLYMVGMFLCTMGRPVLTVIHKLQTGLTKLLGGYVPIKTDGESDTGIEEVLND